MSLREHLNTLIKERGHLTYGEMAQICVEEGYKVSTGERRLRESESPFVQSVKKVSKRGSLYTAVYEWKGIDTPLPPENPAESQKTGQISLLEVEVRPTNAINL